MITYESLKELAHALSRATGYRYVAFRKAFFGDLLVCLSDRKMLWREPKEDHFGVWRCCLDRIIVPIQDLPKLDWSKCQFDCKEADNGSFD